MFPSKKQLAYAEKISEKLHIDIPDRTSLQSVNDFINQYKKTFFQVENQEIRNRIIQEIAITDYAASLGFTLVKKGKYYSLKEHDSVMIDPEKNYFFRNSMPGAGNSIGYGDTVIGFAEMFSGQSKKEVMAKLSAKLSQDGYTYPSDSNQKAAEHTSQKPSLQLPPAGTNMRRVFAYLTKSRYIDPDIVQYFVSQKWLYQDQRGNCVFVGYHNSEPVYGCLRGTNTNHKFVGDCEGCNYDIGIYLNHGQKIMLVFEAPIDAMSYMSILKAKGQDIMQFNYLILAGACKTLAVAEHTKTDKIDQIIMAVDNDAGGRKSIESTACLIKQQMEDITVLESLPEHGKDWNEELKYALQHGTSYQKIPLITNVVYDFSNSSCSANYLKAISETSKNLGLDFSEGLEK